MQLGCFILVLTVFVFVSKLFLILHGFVKHSRNINIGITFSSSVFRFLGDFTTYIITEIFPKASLQKVVGAA